MLRFRSIGTLAWKSSAMVLVSMALLAGVRASADTLQNLQTAFNGESNANARYMAFAKQADSEGYGEVASLFRAAARAEMIHANNHAAVIKEMGGVPKANIEQPAVKSTRENLEAAIKGETYEFETMYPDFLKQAKADRNAPAVRTMNLAKTAEVEHAKLYKAALDKLDTLKGTKSVAFFVCPTCGYTVREVNFAKCPSCFTPKEQFEKVS
jgi:rubrerythrin